MSDILVFIGFLALLILGHEFGHFVMARLRGVKVNEFGIGFPPRLLTLFTAGGTRFTVNAIPIGGFVRPAGEDDPSVPGGLAGAPKATRALVLLAGPVANILLGILAFTAAYKFAAPDPTRVVITQIAAGSPAEAAGLQPGDLILRFNDIEIDSFEALRDATAANLDTLIELTVLRQEETITVEATPRSDHPEDEGPLGITIGHPTLRATWGQAARYAIDSVVLQVENLALLPSRLARGEIAPEQARVSGLKGIYDMFAWAGQIDRDAQRPFLTLNLVGIISIGLAVFNLLPFPALDGGRLAFVAVEAVFRRRVSPRHEGWAHAIGIVLLLILFAYVNFQDFSNPIILPR
jgi:regulator of sigma E protease